LGPSGYKTAVPKWEEAEATMSAKGITPAIANWTERSKQWFYMHGGSLHPETRHILGPMDKASTDLVKAIADS
jgi:hypothetical protein